MSGERFYQGGEFRARTTAPDRSRYPMKGGQGDYEPRDVMLTWTTRDGLSWTFYAAVIRGPQIEARTGELSRFDTHQTIYLNDSTYAECEPAWLAGLVVEAAPGGAA